MKSTDQFNYLLGIMDVLIINQEKETEILSMVRTQLGTLNISPAQALSILNKIESITQRTKGYQEHLTGLTNILKNKYPIT